MFRNIRKKQNEQSLEVAKDLLSKGKRGVIAVHGDDGYPYALPINYFYDEEQNKIYFHGAKAGHKVDAIKANDKVSFTMMGDEQYVEGEWAPYVKSVVVFGRCRLITDEQKALHHIRILADKYYPSKDIIQEAIDRSMRAVQMYEISIEHMSAKQVHEK